MKRDLLLCIAVVGLFLSLPNSQQRAVAQALREPTIDDRFRDAGPKAPDAELPVLNPPQVKPTLENRESDNNTGPAYLGATFSTDSREAVVTAVTPGSPAEQAGLRPTDVIESLQGRPVRSYQDVLDIVATMRPGEMLDLEFSRRINVRTKAALASLPPATQHSVGYPPELPASSYDVPANSEHELLPVPSNGQSNRNTTPQRQSGNASGQRRDQNLDKGQTDGNRGSRGRLRRR